MMEDAQQTIDLVDRYEGGLVTPDELVSLHNFKNLAETFYSPPAWLHGQMRQYELRLKDEAVEKAAEAAATPRSADALAQSVGQQQEEANRAAEAAKQLRRASARPEISAVISDLHGEVKRSAQAPGGAVSMLDYAASLMDGATSTPPYRLRCVAFRSVAGLILSVWRSLLAVAVVGNPSSFVTLILWQTMVRWSIQIILRHRRETAVRGLFLLRITALPLAHYEVWKGMQP